MACDRQGRPLRLTITPGQANDMPQAEWLVDGFRPSHVIADRGYDSGALLDAIQAAGAEAVIPPHPRPPPPKPYAKHIYSERNVNQRLLKRL